MKVFFSRGLLSSEATENLIISRCSEVDQEKKRVMDDDNVKVAE